MLKAHSYWSEVPGVTKGYQDKFMTLSCQLPMVITFVLLILLITMKIQFKNKILDFLGMISLEIYLLHGLFLDQFSINGQVAITDPFLYTLAVIGASIVLATVVHYICKVLISFIVKNRN
jgi:peptidoglycan/LPS O-acetylase OafA/YrhL